MLTLVYVTCLIYSQGGFLMYTVFHRNYAWCSCKFSQVFQFLPEIFLAGRPASNIKPELHWLHHDTLIGLKVLIFAFFNYIQFLNYFPFFQLFSNYFLFSQLFPIFQLFPPSPNFHIICHTQQMHHLCKSLVSFNKNDFQT